MHVLCNNIQWDTDGEDRKKCGLPEIVVFLDMDDDLNGEELSEELGDLLSDEFGFCHKGFEHDTFSQLLSSGADIAIVRV